MVINVYTISIIFSLVFLFIVIQLVRKGKIQERYSILWILMSTILPVLSLMPIILNKLALWLDIENPPSVLFFFGLVYLLTYSLHLTVVVSKQSERIVRLTQEIGLIKNDLPAIKEEGKKPNQF